jgi:hypothetical protein
VKKPAGRPEQLAKVEPIEESAPVVNIITPPTERTTITGVRIIDANEPTDIRIPAAPAAKPERPVKLPAVQRQEVRERERVLAFWASRVGHELDEIESLLGLDEQQVEWAEPCDLDSRQLAEIAEKLQGLSDRIWVDRQRVGVLRNRRTH